VTLTKLGHIVKDKLDQVVDELFVFVCLHRMLSDDLYLLRILWEPRSCIRGNDDGGIGIFCPF
jgi:hypothetical protein